VVAGLLEKNQPSLELYFTVIGILKEHDAGAKAEDLCRRHGISGTTFYKWKAKFGGMEASDAKRLRALEDENRMRLIRMISNVGGMPTLHV
jgi:putative transposase